MTTAEVVQMLANSDTKLSDALRAAFVIPEVLADPELRDWINSELVGYRDSDEGDVPEFRRHRLAVHGNASNGAWYHKNVVVPTHSFSSRIRDYGAREIVLKDAVGGFEGALESGSGDPGIPWPTENVSALNYEIAQGGTGVDDSYSFGEVWFLVPRGLIHQLLELIRQRALMAVIERIPRDELAAGVSNVLPVVPTNVAVQGFGNQVIVASPGASASLTVNQGDRAALVEALASMGVARDQLEELHEVLDEVEVDEARRLMRVLTWCRSVASDLGINTVAGAAATLILQYLGLV